MRLREPEKQSIVRAIKSVEPDSKIYLFGSRVDDSGKGGDIDILVITEKMTYRDKLAIKREFLQK